jgi:hypothetical protein
MSGELRDKFYGSTIDERLMQVPNELAIDAVGLWQIVSFGRQGFDLSGEPLNEYVRRHILALLGKGAKPVTGARDGVHLWTVVDYGQELEEIALMSSSEGILLPPWLGPVEGNADLDTFSTDLSS